MITRSEIRQSFTRDMVLFPQAEKDAWLIKGDFDHFKLTNDLYGRLITDYLLDWTVRVIEAELSRAERRLGCGALLFNVVGDDLTISIPPSTLAAGEIARLLCQIRDAVRETFWQRYMVGALPLPADFFEDVSPQALVMIRKELDGINAVLDLARRQRGYLLLLPVAQDGTAEKVFERVLHIIQRWSGKPVPPVALALDWIFDPTGATWHTYNAGYVYPPMVSFAACPGRVGMPGGAPGGLPQYERVSLACQAALLLCKQQGQGVWISQDHDRSPDALCPADVVHPVDVLHPSDPFQQQYRARHRKIRWTSERGLRDRLNFRPLSRAVLFQFNPVYIPEQMPAGFVHLEKYRGNLYGVGLKGINELCGQHAADRVIRQWLAICSDEMQTALGAKGIAPERVGAAQFVDRFTVCCEQPVFDLQEITALVGRLAAQFNAVSPEINVSQVRTSAVFGDSMQPGYQLFHQLDQTCRSPRCALVEDAATPTGAPAGVPIEVRQNSSAALEEGQTALERESLASARRLAVLDGCVLH